MLLDAGKTRDLLAYIHQRRDSYLALLKSTCNKNSKMMATFSSCTWLVVLALKYTTLFSLELSIQILLFKTVFLNFDGVVEVAGYGFAEQ